MCLLVINKKETKFSDEFLDGVFRRNGDGIGVMYAENGTLFVQRSVPSTAEEARNFYRKHADGRDCVVHWRMRTAGNIDLANCHPYEVFGDGTEMPLYMAHNGVLATGNGKDQRMSDTYWYIEDYIKPLLSANPHLVFNKAFISMVSSHIGGGNKFAFMNHEGKIAVMNEQAFIAYEGSLLSNTYAWDYTGLHPDAKKYTPPPYNYGGWSKYDDYKRAATTRTPTQAAKVTPTPGKKKVDALNAKKKRVSKGKGKLVHLDTDNKLQSFMDRLDVIAPDVAINIMFSDMRSAIHTAGEQNVDELIELLEYGLVTESQFVRLLIEEPDSIENYLNLSYDQQQLVDAQHELDFGI